MLVTILMDKTNQPHGLIRYASYKELHHNAPVVPLYRRFRVFIYGLILLLSLSGIVYGFTHLSPTEFKVVHERQPLYVLLSDGSIQNKYTIKLLNKTKNTITIHFAIEGLEGATLHGLADMKIEPGKVTPVTALVRAPSRTTKRRSYSNCVYRQSRKLYDRYTLRKYVYES